VSGRGEGRRPGPDPRRDVDDEVEDYLRRRARELEDSGMDPGEARRAAEAAFGDIDAVRRACVRIQRRRRVRAWLGHAVVALGQDLRVGARALLRRPGFSAVAVVTLGLGIGANTALFSLVHAVLLAPLPYPRPERLVQVWEADPQRPTRSPSPADYMDLRRSAGSFQDLTAYTTASGNLSGEGEPEAAAYASVSANFFRTMGVAPALGSTFGPDPVGFGVRRAVLSHDLWQRRFGADPAVVGRTLRLDDEAYEILGVMPPTFRFPDGAELWVAAPGDVPGSRLIGAAAPPMRDVWYHEVVGRLAPGVDLARAGQEMDRLAAGLAADFPDVDGGLRIRLVPLKEETLGDAGRTLWLLLGATGLVLLVACTNVANLLLARGVGRGRELALRAALGAGRARIVTHVLAEALVLALAGGAVGGLLALGGLELLRPVVAAALPRGGDMRLSGGVFAYAAAAALGTALVFGLLPARAAARSGDVARGDRGGTGSRHGRHVGDVLVSFEVAMAVVLVLGAGLLLRSIGRIATVDPGFRTAGLTVAWVGHPGATRLSPDERVGFYREVGARLEALPGVDGVAWTQSSPLDARLGAGLRIEDHPEENRPPDVRWQVVSPDYFRVAGIRVLAGRAFTAGDGSGDPPVGVVSETLARVAFGDADPIGRRVNTGLDGRSPDGTWRWVTVVGVAADTRNRGPTRAPEPVLYRPLAQGGPGFSGDRMLALLRSGGADELVAPPIRRAVWEVEPDAPVYGVARASSLGGVYTGERRLALLLLGVFGGLALVLGAVGTYGVTSFAVGRRTRELGVRLALGAARERVSRMVLRQALMPVGLGLLAGTVAGAASARLLASLLFEVAPLDPLTFAAVPALLLCVSAVAVWIPARRAGRVDPVRSLRAE
jgi:putative ABC transport system permease protein